VKNEHNASGSQQYWCKDCGKHSVLEPKRRYTQEQSEATSRKLWEQIQPAYKGCQSYSDFWEAYPLVFPEETHHCVGKGSDKSILWSVGITL
jgi:hypothetical protein